MIGFDKDFEKQCGEFLEYLYRLAEKQYNDCTDIDTLVQDTLTVLIVKISQGENVEYPKGFLSAVLKNKYNAWLREKYKAEYVEYSDGAISETYNEIEEKEEAERNQDENQITIDDVESEETAENVEQTANDGTDTDGDVGEGTNSDTELSDEPSAEDDIIDVD